VTARARLALTVYWVAVGVYLLDRLTKWLVVANLAHRGPVRGIPGVLYLSYTQNPGGAFGFLGGASWLFVGATVAVSAGIVLMSFRVGRPWMAVAMGLVLGGALGNLTDRIARGPDLSGKVVDFIDFRVWPVFNVADSAIVIGAALVVLSGLMSRGGDRT